MTTNEHGGSRWTIAPADVHAQEVHRDGNVVVGVDASPSARIAVDWAAEEAARLGVGLRLVHAYTLPVSGYPGYTTLPDTLDHTVVAAEQGLLDRVAADLARSHPEVRVTTRLMLDRPAVALRRQSVDAPLTVVGSRGTGRVSGVLMGSVATAIASNNPAPVAVVHCGYQPNAYGAVVVGIDDSPSSEQAIVFAFEAAAARHTDLIAVNAWTDNTVGSPFPLQPQIVAPSVDIQEEQQRILAERLAGWSEKYPDVTVQQKVVARRPVPTLLDYACSAQLVVVGSHGHGSFAGLLLGSTGRSLIARCPCPVVIVRPGRTVHPDRRTADAVGR